MDLDLDLLHRIFAEEAGEHLEAITGALMALEPAADNTDLWESLLRRTHTLKGAAATVGLTATGEASHALEECLAQLRTLPVDPEQVDRLLAATDLLRAMVEQPDERTSARFSSQIIEINKNITTVLDADAQKSSAEAEADEDERRQGQRRKGERRQTERRTGSYRIVDDSRRIWVDLERLDGLMDQSAELLMDRSRLDHRLQELRDLRQEVRAMRQATRRTATEAAAVGGRLRHALKQHAEHADRLTEQAEQLVATMERDCRALRRTSRGMQDQLLGLRMMPLSLLHTRFQRVVRQASRELGKEVELQIEDEAAELDRSVAEQIADPLIQLLRNAAVHGVERPEERRLAGKPRRGLIRLTARHYGDVIYLQVTDDGRGIDAEQLREKLRGYKGLHGVDLDALADEELLDTIFLSGVTTRVKVDGLAGRGVGMDVVRQNISRLGGDIRVASRPGHGTTFTIQMPFTTAIAQALLFKEGGQSYAIPAAHVEETVLVWPDQIREQDDGTLLQTREGWIPLLYLHRLLGTPAPLPLRRDRQPGFVLLRLPVIIIRLSNVRFGITCTRVVGRREVVLKGLSSLLAPHPLLAAATVSGTNTVQFVLDVAFLARAVTLGPQASGSGEGGEGGEGGHYPRPRQADEAVSVLLADDSPTVRARVCRILAASGYAVDQAEDGQAAWEKLQGGSYRLLLTDLEMPRLHGLELIDRCRGCEPLAELPILVISSRTSPGGQQQALLRGASRFLAKPVSEQALLEELDALPLNKPEKSL